MKALCCFLIMFLVISCTSTHNVEIKEYKTNRPEWLKKTLLEGYSAKEDYYSVLVFTAGFNGEKLQILNPEVKLEEVLNSDESMGLARGFRISNNESLKIIIEETMIKLSKQNIAKYKFIYLEKNFDDKYPFTVTYSKTPRNFK